MTIKSKLLKIKEQIRCWLIVKLHGYTHQKVVQPWVINFRPAELTTTFSLPMVSDTDQERELLTDATTFMCRKIAEALIENDSVYIQYKTNEFSQMIDFRASVFVASREAVSQIYGPHKATLKDLLRDRRC